tara:strand:- start:2028 stop:2324 length:297 start_codon:yes stop_codon:yes gene_type:complete
MYSAPIMILIILKMKEIITRKKTDPKYIDMITNFTRVNGSSERINVHTIHQFNSQDVANWVKREYNEKSEIIEKINQESDIPKWAKQEYLIKNITYKD